jgi:hypothetical protein
MRKEREVPVYLFTGILECGKTSFIRDTLNDPGFHHGEKTLVILCEEGIEEYDEVELIKKDIPNDPAYSSLFVEDVVFIEINIDGSEIQTGNDVIYNHQNYIFYGSPYLIENKVLGNPVDLLKN